MALVDGNGSTIAMVANATGDVASTYTYDPLGKASYGGSYITAYQYLGMENETLSGTTWAYYGGGTYYSPVLGRPLTIQGPITSAGGFGSGPGAMVGGALPGGSGDVPVNPFLSVPGAAAPAYLGAEGAGVGLAVGSMFFTGVEAGSTYGPPGAIIGGLLGALAGVLEDLLGGGGPSEPWWWIREDTHPGGSPSTWAPLYGMPAAYPPNQEKSAPSPSQYAKWGRTANWLQNLVNLYEFHRGGALDAQRYGATPAYGRYVFGVYMAAHGYSLSTTLSSANTYGHWFSHYSPRTPMGGPMYPSIPTAEVAEITRGWTDERSGMYGLP